MSIFFNVKMPREINFQSNLVIVLGIVYDNNAIL